jgi:hypothetical protein
MPTVRCGCGESPPATADPYAEANARRRVGALRFDWDARQGAGHRLDRKTVAVEWQAPEGLHRAWVWASAVDQRSTD